MPLTPVVSGLSAMGDCSLESFVELVLPLKTVASILKWSGFAIGELPVV